MSAQEWEDVVVRFRQIRISLGLRVQEVAERAEVDRSTISLYEGRRVRPGSEALRVWRSALISLAKERGAHSQIALNDLGAA